MLNKCILISLGLILACGCIAPEIAVVPEVPTMVITRVEGESIELSYQGDYIKFYNPKCNITSWDIAMGWDSSQVYLYNSLHVAFGWQTYSEISAKSDEQIVAEWVAFRKQTESDQLNWTIAENQEKMDRANRTTTRRYEVEGLS